MQFGKWLKTTKNVLQSHCVSFSLHFEGLLYSPTLINQREKNHFKTPSKLIFQPPNSSDNL